MKNEVLIKADKVSKKFCRNLKKSLWYGIKDITGEIFFSKESHNDLRSGEFWALQDISFELRRGECLGLIGRNGAGKSTLLKLLNGLIKPDRGIIYLKGRVGALIELGAGFNPILSGRENIYINAAVLGIKKKEIEKKIEDIIDFSEIREFIDMPVQSYSSGMKVRLGFSIATAMKPDILLLDEVLAVGDAGFRAKCFQRIGKLLKNTAVIFVSHDMAQVSRICDISMVLNGGLNIYLGNTKTAVDKYLLLLSNQNKQISDIVLDSRIIGFDCIIKQKKIMYGETLGIQLMFDSKEDLSTGLCLIAFGKEGFYCSQTDFTSRLKIIPQGKSTFSIDVGPIHLSKDEYHVTVTILDPTKKSTLVHVINHNTFSVIGSRGYGVSYQIPHVREEKI